MDSVDAMRPRIEDDGVVVFFPTCAHLTADGGAWVLPIHGWIYEPDRANKIRRASLALFRRYLRFKTKEDLTPLFPDRALGFFANKPRGKHITIRIGNRLFPIGKSAFNGHFKGTVQLPVHEVERLRERQGGPEGWLEFEAVHCHPEGRGFPGRVRLLPEEGLSVISDIDDTIKHSVVGNRRELLANTFLRNFTAIPDAAEVYRYWAALGAEFHYVSSSPWQLYGPLSQFLGQEGFPDGTYHLKLMRLRDSRPFKMFVRRPESKARTIETILRNFPGRRFVLIGDSGERDPEIYGELARRFPEQVVQIFIRDITGHEPASERFRQAFNGAAAERWSLYRQIDELRARHLWLASNPVPSPT
jgi:hypothetical protein